MCSLITTTNRNHVLLPPLGLLIFYFSCLVLGGDKLLRFLRRQGSSRQIKQTPIVEIYIFLLLFWLWLIDVFMAQESSNLLCKFSYLNHLTGSNEREAESDIKSLQDQRHKHLKEVDYQRMLQYFPILFICKAFFLYKNAPNAEYSVLYKILFILIWNSSCCFACQIIDIHTNLKRHKAFSPLNMFYLLPFCSLWRIVNMYHVKKLVYK